MMNATVTDLPFVADYVAGDEKTSPETRRNRRTDASRLPERGTIGGGAMRQGPEVAQKSTQSGLLWAGMAAPVGQGNGAVWGQIVDADGGVESSGAGDAKTEDLKIWHQV